MKLTIDRDELLRALSHVQSVVEKRTTIPILSNVLLSTDEGRLSLTATDMDLEMVDAAAAEIEQPGSTTVPAHTFYDIIRKLPDDSLVAMEINDEGTMMNLSCGRSKFRLGCLPKEDFPEMTTAETEDGFFIPAATLHAMIDHTKFAISTEETRYYLNGIYVHVAETADGKVLRAVATDGHRLARYETALPDGAAQMPNMIVPRKTIQELGKLMDDTEESVHVRFSDKTVRFGFGHVRLTSKLIDGTFPDYERVIPKNNTKMVQVDPKAFRIAVDRVSTIAAEKTRAIKLSIQGQSMVLTASNTESGTASEELEITYDANEAIDIGFNARYLMDVTQLLENNCSISLNDSASPTIIQDNQDPASLYVLMPMRV